MNENQLPTTDTQEEQNAMQEEKMAVFRLLRVVLRLFLVSWVCTAALVGYGLPRHTSEGIALALLFAAIAVGILFACGLRIKLKPKQKRQKSPVAVPQPSIPKMTKPPVQTFRR